VISQGRRTPAALLGKLSVAAITIYQRSLSPLKGFSCAHRV